jgi:hypothetical protein
MISRIRLKTPLVVKKGDPHPLKAIEKYFGGLWICETNGHLDRKRGLGPGAWECLGFIRV